MKTLKRILAATTLLVTLGFASEANAQVPLENFFKNPEKAGYQISPDGKYFSYMAPYENRLNLFVQEVGSDKATRITSETGFSGTIFYRPPYLRIHTGGKQREQS